MQSEQAIEFVEPTVTWRRQCQFATYFAVVAITVRCGNGQAVGRAAQNNEHKACIACALAKVSPGIPLAIAAAPANLSMSRLLIMPTSVESRETLTATSCPARYFPHARLLCAIRR